MVRFGLLSKDGPDRKSLLRIEAVSYLNTLPLVWGFLHGKQRDSVDLSFSVPAVCAERISNGDADVGLVPCAELSHLRGAPLRDVGIICRGAVRSILLVSKVDLTSIRILAVDAGSRTSVKLAQILLSHRYGVTPQIVRRSPNLESMLHDSDAALIIGDPALHLDPERLPYRVVDLGLEWVEWTGLPMVFAVWAGQRECTESERKLFVDSCRFGLAHLDDIVCEAVRKRGFPETLAREYVTRHLAYELGEEDRKGMDLFLRLATDLNRS